MESTHRQFTMPVNKMLVLGATVLLGCVFYCTEHQWDYSTLQGFQQLAEDAASDQAEGKAVRKVAFGLMAAVGLGLLLTPSAKRLNVDNPLSLLVIAYLGWCAMSIVWSDAPAQTVRRLGVLAFCCIGIAGVCRRFSPYQLLLSSTLISLAFLIVGVAAEITHGSFHPWDPSYRFSGTVHPNTQGGYMAILCLSAYFGHRQSATRWRFGWLFLFLLGVSFLLLTKSRSSILGFAVALVFSRLLTAPMRQRTVTAMTTSFLIVACLFVSNVAGIEFDDDAGDFLNRGEGSVSSLNGRVPLWKSLTGYIQERPLLGYGYGAFWSPNRVARVSQEQEWTIASAHSTFLEILLAVGLVGLTLYGLLAGLSIIQTARRYYKTENAGYGFAFGLLSFGLVVAFFESSGVSPVGFDSFITACGVGLVAFRRSVG